jgi:hypothetical protein
MELLLQNQPTTQLSRLKLLGLALLVITLSACSSNLTQPTTIQSDDASYDYILTVDISSTDQQTEIEQAYEGHALVWQPDAGFAVLGLKAGEFTTLSSDAEVNTDAVASPVTAAGNDSWAGGYNAWAGGNDSWAGGYNAWAGGSDIWQVDNQDLGVFAKNVDDFLQINLGLGQDLASNLGEGVIVAVLDTGVALSHPALNGKLTNETTWKDFVDGDNYPDDAASDGNNHAQGHGTAVAGLILQVAPRAKILPIRVLEPDGSGDFSAIISGLEWALKQGADVINLSLGSAEASPSIRKMLAYAAQMGVYVVASSGNTADTHVTFPAKDAYHPAFGSYLIGVGSVDSNDNKSGFSTYSPELELVAPGEQLYTLGPESSVMHVTGTSFATPLTAGALALGIGQATDLLSDTGATQLNADAKSNTLANELVNVSDERIYQGRNQNYLNLLGEGRLDVQAFMLRLISGVN